jgi:D-xylose transport system substrate-binding protein
MRSNLMKFFLTFIALLMVLALVACGSPTEEPAAPAEEAASAEEAAPAEEAAEPVVDESGETVKIGLSFSDFATERWKNEEVLMRDLLEAKGYEVLSQEANHDVKLQIDQIDNMVSQGVAGLIIIAEDGDALTTAVDNAAAQGVAVLAYDRLIKSPNIAAYLSFNNVEVGRQQAMGVMDAIDVENWDVAANGPMRVVKLGGSPTDNNAILFRQGQDEIVDPYVENGTIEIVADQWVDNWDPANALKAMENILTAAGNDIDAVVASNDGTALGALQAMKAQGLAGAVPISGQDATADGVNSIVKGELTVSILKDIRDLSPLAVDMMDQLVKGETIDGLQSYTMAELTNDPSQEGEVDCFFLPVQQVNVDNAYDLVVASEFQAYDDVYRDIPEDQRPARPGEGAAEPAEEVSVEGLKVGLSFSDFATERWKNEEVLMRALLEEKGYEVLSQEANHDVKLQIDQIDNMVSQGVSALIIIAEDGDALTTAVDNAAAQGVVVLAYDRLIKSPNIAAYLSFNNVEVGRQQAMGVMDAIDVANWDVAANGPMRVVKLGGSPTDNNAILFRQGQDEIVDPYVEDGTIEIVADQWVDNWDPANALKAMENILTAAGNDIDAVVASNDGTALGALQAMKAQGLAGSVPISGQDATADGVNSIVKGELTVSILKDIRDLSPLAVDMVDQLVKGETIDGLQSYTMAELTNDPAQEGEVDCFFLPVQQVNADNAYDLVVVSQFQAYDDVYRDIPEDQRPPQP